MTVDISLQYDGNFIEEILKLR